MDWNDRLDDLFLNRNWEGLARLVEESLRETNPDGDIAIETIYRLLDFLLYAKYESDAEYDEIARTLYDQFVNSYSKFSDDAEYLFFVGYFMALGEWYFGQDDLTLSHEMLRRAAEIEPHNLLYAWGYHFSTGGPNGKVLTQQIYSEPEILKFLMSKGLAGKYMIEAIETAYLQDL